MAKQKKRITIRMPKPILRKWLKALRSGKYKQGRNQLMNERGGFCCLGVLQHCLTGAVEMKGDRSASLPSLKWLDANKIAFTCDGKKATAPYLPKLGDSADGANDIGKRFKTIANAIEECAEGI
jgi:hypothetical protein